MQAADTTIVRSQRGQSLWVIEEHNRRKRRPHTYSDTGPVTAGWIHELCHLLIQKEGSHGYHGAPVVVLAFRSAEPP